PALFSMTNAYFGNWLFSKIDNTARAKMDRTGFDAQFVRCQTGIGATGASAH
ncbi:MAG: cation/acetate symporter, partial [Acetobacteraceae bacterium]|nr:cation/acetate symporter [Acetobacteraceae bacterium]